MATGISRGPTADSGGPGGSGGTGRLARPGSAGGWTAGRVGTLVIGSVLALVSLGLLAGERASLGRGLLLTGLVGDVRIRVTATSGRPVFVAIGPADQVAAYLSGTAYATVTGTGAGGIAAHDGTGRPAPPRATGIWVARAAGAGTQVLRWTAQDGDWTAVAMNADGSAGVAVRADAGVSAPGLARLAVEIIIGGIVLGMLSAALIWVPTRLAAGAG